jgi:hypothetical protein
VMGALARTTRVRIAPTPTHLVPLTESAGPARASGAAASTDSALAIEVGEAMAGESGEIILQLRVVPADEPVPAPLGP